MKVPLRALIRFLTASLAIGAPTVLPAHGETVLVRAQNGEEGHAWLFGSKGECWLAVPMHVVADPFDRRSRSFIFTDRTGRPGEAETPTAAIEVTGAVEALDGTKDLAFARVASGRRKGECLSRLGLPTAAYENVLSAGKPLTVFNLLSTSFGIFQMEVSRARADRSGGGLLILEALSKQDASLHVKRGLSGSTAQIERGDTNYPFAMILQAEPDTGLARALRFDLIKAAFDLVEAEDLGRRRDARANADGVPYRILGFDGSTLAGAPSVVGTQGCWRVMARGGTATVSLDIELSDPKDKIRALTFEGDVGCSNSGGSITVSQRVRSEDAWSRASACTMSDDGSTTEPCRLELRGPRQLRIELLPVSWTRG